MDLREKHKRLVFVRLFLLLLLRFMNKRAEVCVCVCLCVIRPARIQCVLQVYHVMVFMYVWAIVLGLWTRTAKI